MYRVTKGLKLRQLTKVVETVPTAAISVSDGLAGQSWPPRRDPSKEIQSNQASGGVLVRQLGHRGQGGRRVPVPVSLI